jgi:CheY-like chemotaxis protein
VNIENPQTILLIEDAEEDVFFFRMALRKCGLAAKLEVLSDGEAAWDYLKNPEKRRGLSVVFLDLKLPLMTGFEILERLRREEILLECPVVVLSGSCEDVDKERAKTLGVSEYLVKPITAKMLNRFLPCPAIA